MKFNIISYIKPTPSFEMFASSLAKIQKSKYLNKIIISFVVKLTDDFVNELNKYNNIIWKDEVDNYWASEMKQLMDKNDAECFYTWEEDSDIYNIEQFDKSYENMINKNIDYLLTLDTKWIERAQFLENKKIARRDNGFIYFKWGTYTAKFCREHSSIKTINGAYPVSIGGVFKKELLYSLLNQFLDSTYFKSITTEGYQHYHQNPNLPHSFEIFPGFWWKGINNGYGDISYSAMVSEMQFGKELGGRLNT